MDLAADSLLKLLFDRMPMGVAIFDAELRLQRCNPTWAEFIDRYTPSSADQVTPGVYFFDLAPDTEAQAMPIFERVLAGETVRQKAVPLESGDRRCLRKRCRPWFTPPPSRPHPATI